MCRSLRVGTSDRKRHALGNRHMICAAGVVDDLGQPEHRHHNDDEIDAFVELAEAEGETREPGGAVLTDHADDQAERRHRQALQQRAARQHGSGDQPDQHEREIFRRLESQCQLRQRRRQRRHQHDRDAGAEERRHRGHHQRRPGAALPRHRIALDHGDGGGRVARQPQQDRRDRAAIHGAVVDAGEHDQRFGRAQMERDRQQHADRRDRPDAGQDADEHSDADADQAVQQRRWRQCDAESEREVVEEFHQRGQSVMGSPRR